VSRDLISDEAWAVIGPLFPQPKGTGRPPVGRRQVVPVAGMRPRRRLSQAAERSLGGRRGLR
jgi:transposase